MSNAKFASFFVDFKELNIILRNAYNKYKDNLNSYKKA